MNEFVPVASIPKHTPDNQPFWDAWKEGVLLLSRCGDCGAHHFCRENACPVCLSTCLEWVEASGKGRLYSYVIGHHPAFANDEETSAIIAVIELDEGPRIMSRLTDVSPPYDELTVGMSLEAAFDGDVPAYRFRPSCRAESRASYP